MPFTSPFKFLDAYNKEDKDIFFGRDIEVEQLYELVYQSNLTLVYGQSGTGKTSLIQCGLANRFEQADWFNVYIRRNEDINQSLLDTLKGFRVEDTSKSTLADRLKRHRRGPAKKDTQQEDSTDGNELIRRLQALYKFYLKPIYLIFDQFEELFILGNHSEQQLFYHSIARVLETEPYCHVIIIMREELIAQLYDFEKVVELLFEKRLRVEKMSRARTEEVIRRTTGKFGIQMENDTIPDQIIEVLSVGEGQVELTYLQVFLDQLYQEAVRTSSNGITYNAALIQKLGNIEDVLGDFLIRQTSSIQHALENQSEDVSPLAVNNILSVFVTLEGTRRPVVKEQIRTGDLSIKQVEFIIGELEHSRILRYENKLYELSHDTLARQVAEQRSAEEVAVLQIIKLIRDRKQAFASTKTWLNGNELQLISGFRKQLEEAKRLAEEDWAFVRQSTRINRRRRLILVGIVLGIIAILTAFSIYSYQLSITAENNKEEAEENLRQLEAVRAQEKAANYNRFLEAGNARMALSDYIGAKEAYETALTFDSLGTEARDSIRVAESRSTASEQFEQFMREGDALFARNNNSLFVDALQKYQAALSLNYNNSRAQRRIDETRAKLAFAFEKFKSDGDIFFNANSYQLALNNYEQARRIRPNDSYIQQQILKTRRLMGN